MRGRFTTSQTGMAPLPVFALLTIAVKSRILSSLSSFPAKKKLDFGLILEIKDSSTVPKVFPVLNFTGYGRVTGYCTNGHPMKAPNQFGLHPMDSILCNHSFKLVISTKCLPPLIMKSKVQLHSSSLRSR